MISIGCRNIPEPKLHRFEYASPQMGTLFTITLYAESEMQAEEAAQAAFDRVAQLEDILSDYMADSELMRLALSQAGEPVTVSDDLYHVLLRGNEISAHTKGAFDLTAGPFTRLWRFSRKRGTLPSETDLSAARAVVGWHNLLPSTNTQTVALRMDGMRLDAGGIAKGYAADEAMQVLKDHGIHRALIAASGDILTSQSPPGTEGWRVTVASPGGSRLSGWVGSSFGADTDSLSTTGGSSVSLAISGAVEPAAGRAPAQTLRVRNAAVSTSGDTEQFVEIDGVRYSHIVSPFTGLGLTNRIQATVIAPNATTSDALATACCILGPEQAIDLVDSLPEVEAIIMTKEGGETQVWRSNRAP